MDGVSTNWTVGTHAVSVVDGSGTTLGGATFYVCANNKVTCP
jgi:hypothetical protein